MTPRRTMRLLVVAAVVLAVSAVALLGTRGPVVSVRTVTRQPLLQTVVLSGRVAAPALVTVGATIVGRVAAVEVREGDLVKAGDVLLRLEDAEARAAVAEAEAAVAVARAKLDLVRRVTGRIAGEDVRQAAASLDLARQAHERARALFATGAATAQAVDEARAALEVAESRLEGARARATGSSAAGAEARAAAASLAQAMGALDAARARLDQTRVVAPADAVVLRRSVEPGDVVQPAQRLLVLGLAGPPHVVVEPDEKDLRLVREGQDVVISADAFPEETFEGRVQRIAPAVDRQRGTVEVRIEVPSPPHFLRPDMTVSAEVIVGRRESALVVPEEALRDGGGARPWVLLVEGERVERRDVRIGLRGDRVVEVASGLDEGERVVVADGARLRPGDRVRPREAD